jgi:F-type H+-transporting ATPase subunit b
MRLKKLLATTSLAAFFILSPAATHFASATTETTIAVEGATAEVVAEEAPAAEGAAKEGKVKLTEAAEHCIHQLEAGEPIDNCQKAPNPILPPVNELVWGALAFFIVFAGLAKFALPAMGKTLAARSAKIEGDLNAAAKAKTDAEAEGASYRAKVGDAKAEGDKILDDARAQAEIVRRDVLARAEADAAEIRRKATEESAASSTRLKGELEGHVKRLSVDLAEKVVGANLNRETNAALVDKYIAELAK